MADAKIELSNCWLDIDDDEIVELHIMSNCVVEADEVDEIFENIHQNFAGAKGLLVTAGKQASLSQEAREKVSAGNVTKQIIADAIVVKDYQHHMTANFFVRYNKPQRPTEIFKTDEEARKWLKNKIQS
ncbi:MAG: hypothetical protein MK086_07470 [Flavobacteriales bacterium]|nr:hypothetical protein [Flavobacteriales bacterium]